MSEKILIVDDEPDILELLRYNIEKEGYFVDTCTNGVDAIAKIKNHKPDLVLLDAMMPYKDGIQTCKEIRKNKEWDSIFIIFLTALSDEKNELQGLQAGADDYIAKPIKPKVLISRIQTVLRRKPITEKQSLQFPELEINREQFQVIYKNIPIQLPKKEFELFALLASKPGKVFLRHEILEKIWGNEVIVGDRTIDVHVRKIRQKLNVDFIATVKGVGYKFEY